MINATAKNRNVLRKHAREALSDYSPVMTWLLLSDNGDLSILQEPQGQTCYVGDEEVLAETGGFYKAHGNGAAVDRYGRKFSTQRDYLIDLLGRDEYNRVFGFVTEKKTA